MSLWHFCRTILVRYFEIEILLWIHYIYFILILNHRFFGFFDVNYIFTKVSLRFFFSNYDKPFYYIFFIVFIFYLALHRNDEKLLVGEGVVNWLTLTYCLKLRVFVNYIYVLFLSIILLILIRRVSLPFFSVDIFLIKRIIYILDSYCNDEKW